MRTRGFTLVEMMVYIVLSGIVMTSVYQSVADRPEPVVREAAGIDGCAWQPEGGVRPALLGNTPDLGGGRRYLRYRRQLHTAAAR